MISPVNILQEFLKPISWADECLWRFDCKNQPYLLCEKIIVYPVPFDSFLRLGLHVKEVAKHHNVLPLMAIAGECTRDECHWTTRVAFKNGVLVQWIGINQVSWYDQLVLCGMDESELAEDFESRLAIKSIGETDNA